MIRPMLIACLAATMLSSPALAEQHSRKKAKTAETKSKTETAASCKMPAIGPCPSCAITCRPGETATCGPGQVAADTCVKQPACSCNVR